MKIRYFVKQLTNEGRLVDPEDDGPYYDRTNPLDVYNGYESEREAEEALEKCLTKNVYPYSSMCFVVVKLYMEGDSDES